MDVISSFFAANEREILFVLECGVLGVVALVADIVCYRLKDTSLLGLTRGSRSFWPYFVIWPIGSMIVGFLGQIMHILQISHFSCIITGFGWYGLMQKIITTINNFVEDKERAGDGE